MKVIFSHCTQSYPITFSASNTKVEYIAKGLYELNTEVTIINDSLGDRRVIKTECNTKENIRYYIFPRRNNQFFSFIKNLYYCIVILKKEYKKNDKNILFVGGIFPVFFLQLIIGRFIGYKCVYLTQEWALSLKTTNIIYKLSAVASCYWYGYFLNAILPISHFLWDKNLHFKKPMHIVPILCSFEGGANQTASVNYNHFTYCVSASYFRVISMILKAFKIFKQKGGQQTLILIVSGKTEEINKIQNYIQNMNLKQDIIIKSQIPYDELIKLYQTSLGLIIPLDPHSTADKARFSQKIAEYLSTRRPIITNNVGEIPYYFNNKENAIITKYNAEDLSQAMFYLASNPQKANEIGESGFQTGKQFFDYKRNSLALYNFFKSL